MRSLDELQKQFQAFLLQNQSGIESDIVSTEKVPALQRLQIYQDAYYSRLLEVLQQDYPVLCHCLGSDEFEQLGRDYIDAHPSRYRSIRWFGSGLSHFANQHPLYSAHPWVYELASFEWLLMETFDACDHPVLMLEEMAAIPPHKWAETRFIVSPSLRRLNLHWNVVALWKEKMEKDETKLLPEQTNTAVNWVVWRMGHEVQFASLTTDQAYLLDAMADNQNFGTLCEGLCKWVKEDEVALHAAQQLKRFIADKMLAGILLA